MKPDMRRFVLMVCTAVGLSLSPLVAHAQGWDQPLALRDSIPIGSNGLCEAQISAPQPGDGLFDRRYQVICRDAAAPVGQLAVLGDPAMAAQLYQGLECSPGQGADLPGLANTSSFACTAPDGLSRAVITGQSGAMTYVGSGIAIYGDALRLGLTSLATGQMVPGEVNIPLTEAGDAAAFARAQAEALSPDVALAEAYRRGNAGSFAEAAEFFAVSSLDLDGSNGLEARLNSALQQSNLGNYLPAALAFIAAREELGEDPVLTRLARNFETVDALNREQPGEALAILDTPLPGSASAIDALRGLQISDLLATRLAAEQGNAISAASNQLTTLERVQLLDAQATYLRAAAMRSQGRPDAAASLLDKAYADLISVRDGRIASVLWLRAQMLGEMAETRAAAGDLAGAENLLGQSIALLENYYPGTPALASAKAQYAAFLAGNGREEEALALYDAIIDDSASKPSVALRRLLAPYFRLLTTRPDAAATPARMFAASQLLQRPGLAQTQAVLARELSGGSDAAAQLFRQSVNLTRAVERQRLEIAQINIDAGSNPDATMRSLLDDRRLQLAALQTRQLALQEQLAQYPRYRVVSDNRMTLVDLQATLNPGEAYYKLALLGDEAYAIFVEAGTARGFAIAKDASEIEGDVAFLRDSIALEQGGQTITYPFEIARARSLYQTLFGPVAGQLQQASHLIFEPDGAMLQLPVNLLVTDDASVERYASRLSADTAADPYDFRGTAWLGRQMQVTTSVSPASFRDVRAARRSNARGAYLGLGQNIPLGSSAIPNPGVRSAGALDARCQWSASTWNNPILDAELRQAGAILTRDGDEAALLTGADFTDTRLKAMDELDEYRILHFATHGLVTAPRSQCPPRPALLTSFGDGQSDGLLSFAEIFDLRLDADLVILSACNTASVGGLVATREAGVAGGGDYALDGLVRAFVGAGGRTVVASHWPVPDDFDATNRLISAFFDAGAGVSTSESLRRAQLGLMDDAATSHPFYWSAFAVVGDGTVPVRP